jgi:hypothetical protein
MRLGIFVVLATTGCATADRGETITVGGHPDSGFGSNTIDAPGGQQIDAPAQMMIDAPPGQQTMTLTQNSSPTLLANNSIACGAASPDIGTTQNTYYRVFDLPSLGINTDFNVTTVSFQVEDCESNGTGAAVAVRVGTYNGTPGATLSPAGITILQSNNSVQVPTVIETTTSTPGASVDAPINATIPAGSKMVVEVDAPDGTNTYQFYIGTNMAGQTGVGYISSPKCANPGTTPTDMGSVVSATTKIDMLLTVTGSY